MHDDSRGTDSLVEAIGKIRPDGRDRVARDAKQRARAVLVGGRGEPERIGRFVRLSKVGAGAMGSVYSAHDPTLDRVIALKLVGIEDAQAGPGVLREARALARLTHPNVVPVYEAGIVEDTVYIAMEFVTGGNLRSWVAEAERSVGDLVRVFDEAGRGLAAAHGAGLVHGDFKPENVLVGEDGRARVADFGLARSRGVHDRLGTTQQQPAVRRTDLQTLSRGGTPAYMAPEQLNGAAATTASDQFAFCVGLYEAIYGIRPFTGETVSALTDAIERGALPPVRAGGRVPASVRQALRRGLAVDPAQRFPTVEALLECLGRGRARRRRRWVVVAVTAALGVGAVAAGAWARGDAEARCRSAAAQFGATWGKGRKGRTRAAFMAMGKAFAVESFEKVDDSLEAYRERWISEHTDACEATHVRGEQSEARLDARMLCLRGQLAAVDELVGALEVAEFKNVERAIRAAAALVPPRRCNEPWALRGPQAFAELAPERHDAAQRALDLVARSRSARKIGNMSDALEHATEAVSLADSVEDVGLRAHTGVELGRVLDATEDSATGPTFERALASAVESKNDVLAAQVANALLARTLNEESLGHSLVLLPMVRAVVQRSGSLDEVAELDLTEAGIWMEERKFGKALALANGVLAYFEGEGERREFGVAIVQLTLAQCYTYMGDSAAAVASATAALTRFRAFLGDSHPQISDPLNVLAAAYRAAGEHAESERLYREAAGIIEAARGPDDFSLAYVLGGLAHNLVGRQRFSEAVPVLERALHIHDAHPGLHDRGRAHVMENLGVAYTQIGENDRARALFSSVLEVSLKLFGPDHIAVASVHGSWAYLSRLVGDFEDARSQLSDAVRIADLTYPQGHEHVARFVGALGELALVMGDPEEARRLCTRAVAVGTAAIGVSDPGLAAHRTCLGEAMLALGDAPGATEQLERALALVGTDTADAVERARTLFALARARVQQDRVSADRYAAQALALLQPQPGPDAVAMLARLNTWAVANAE